MLLVKGLEKMPPAGDVRSVSLWSRAEVPALQMERVEVQTLKMVLAATPVWEGDFAEVLLS